MSTRAARIARRPGAVVSGAVLVADLVAAAAIVFVVFDPSELRSGIVGAASLVLWAVTPRLAAEWLEPPSRLLSIRNEFTRAHQLAALASMLGIAATIQLWYVLPLTRAAIGLESLLLFWAWVMAFALREPAAYRIYEPLACLTMVTALLRGHAHAVPFVGIAFLALCFSAAVRHQLAACAAAGRRARAPLEGARGAALLVALILVLIFAGAQAGLAPVLERIGQGSRTQTQSPVRHRTPASDSESGLPGSGGSPDDGAPSFGRGRRSQLRDWGSVAPVSLRRDAVGEEGGEAEAEIMRITPSFLPRSGTDDEKWLPGPKTLWKGWTYTRFDPRTQQWSGANRSEWARASGRGGVMRLGAAPAAGGTTKWEITVIAPKLDSLCLPYYTIQASFPSRGVEPLEVLATPVGDFPIASGHFPSGERYDVTLRPIDTVGTRRGPGARPGDAVFDHDLEVPGTAEVGVDLHAQALEIIGSTDASVSDIVSRLQKWFGERFRTDRDAAPEDLPDSLAEFLTKRRVGDCRHIASAAALLLRASGVPARLVTGFVGGDRDPASQDYVVRRGSAHAWIEIRTDSGWRPIDTGPWVVEEESAARRELRPDDDDAPRRRSDRKLLLIAAVAVFLVLAFLLMRGRLRKKKDEPEEKDEPAAEETEAAVLEPPGFVPTTPAGHLLVDYGRLQKDLELAGQQRRTHETPREHARRLLPSGGAPARTAFGELVPLVDDGLYGMESLTDTDLSRGRKAIAEIRREYT